VVQWWESFPDLTQFMLEGPTELPFPIYSQECSMEPGEFVMERFTKAVTGLMDSVREMIGASKLLRARVEGNDQVLARIEQLMREATDRLDLMDQRLTKIENAQGTYPHAIP